MEKSRTIIFIGRAGAGKGTQVERLTAYLSEKGIDTEVVMMGDIYRTFFKTEGFAQDIARDLSMRQGKLQPDFLTNSLFVANVINRVKENNTLVFDGFPRSIGQFELTKELLAYIGRSGVTVINIEVTRESVIKRMMLRARGDDTQSAIETRLDEYDRSVVPMVEAMKHDPFCAYIEIDGEPTVDEIHTAIKESLSI